MKKEYIKPEIKEVLTNCESIFCDTWSAPKSDQTVDTYYSKGNSYFEDDYTDWDE